MELLEFVLTTIYFIFRDKYGVRGLAQQLEVQSMVADMYLEYLEQTAIATVPLDYRSKLWKGFVDDILEITTEMQWKGLHST